MSDDKKNGDRGRRSRSLEQRFGFWLAATIGALVLASIWSMNGQMSTVIERLDWVNDSVLELRVENGDMDKRLRVVEREQDRIHDSDAWWFNR